MIGRHQKDKIKKKKKSKTSTKSTVDQHSMRTTRSITSKALFDLKLTRILGFLFQQFEIIIKIQTTRPQRRRERYQFVIMAHSTQTYLPYSITALF
jgi:hypothetical protein